MTPDRHARQALRIGPEGQARLARAKAMVVGVGGLGCPAATYLAGAGVGTLTLVDPGRVERSNLHRQPLFADVDVGRPKVRVAADRLLGMDPGLTVVATETALDAANAVASVAGHDVVLDCTDSLEARYAISDACAKASIPLVQAGLAGDEGQVALLCGKDGPCYRCLHPRAAEGPTCAEEGILGPLAGMTGSLQALWALHVLLDRNEPAPGTVVTLDLVGAQTLALKRRQGCPAHVQEDGPACPMPWNAPDVTDIAVHDFAPRQGEFFVLDVREPDEFEEIHIPGASLVPLGQLPRRLQEVPKDRPVVCVCAVGGRSARATDFLRQRGYTALNLRGGMRAWMLAGLA